MRRQPVIDLQSLRTEGFALNIKLSLSSLSLGRILHQEGFTLAGRCRQFFLEDMGAVRGILILNVDA